MAVTTFAGGIDRGTAICVLTDGTIVVASSKGKLTRFDAGGVEIDSAAVHEDLRRWSSTVRGLRNSCAATSRLVAPPVRIWRLCKYCGVS